jgi:hypothetical protein
MRKTMLAVAVAILAVASRSASAEESCSGSGTPLPKSAIEAKLKAQGFVQIKETRTHGGCYEVKGFNTAGKRFELEVNSYTGDINNKE